MQDSPANVEQPEWLNAIRWTDAGLVPAIAQDADNGDILMMAWMNRESLRLTVEEGQAVYWSRSRGKLWRKGESSGHQQVIRDLINQMQKDVFKPWDLNECLDVFTHFSAMENLKVRKPKVMQISYGETDEWAHAGMYKNYLNAAHMVEISHYSFFMRQADQECWKRYNNLRYPMIAIKSS